MALQLLPWERYWQEKTDEDFMRDDPDEVNHPIRVRMGKEAERVWMINARIAELSDSTRGQKPKVLDVGCGTAIDHPRLVKLGFEYWAVEPIPKFIARARELHPGIRIEQRRVWDIPFKDNRFDVVWCKGVVQHLPPGTYPEALDELWRVTKTLLMVSTNRVFFAGNPGTTHRLKGGPYNNHYNFKEFLGHVRSLPNSMSRHVKGFVRSENLEEAKKTGLIHTLFMIYNKDYWDKMQEEANNILAEVEE